MFRPDKSDLRFNRFHQILEHVEPAVQVRPRAWCWSGHWSRLQGRYQCRRWRRLWCWLRRRSRCCACSIWRHPNGLQFSCPCQFGSAKNTPFTAAVQLPLYRNCSCIMLSGLFYVHSDHFLRTGTQQTKIEDTVTVFSASPYATICKSFSRTIRVSSIATVDGSASSITR